jgi:hypothetical protein
MPRFYFHVHGASGSTPDEQGRDLPDLEVARREAVKGVRSLLSADIVDGRLDLRSLIQVTDECGNVLLTIPFRQAVEVHEGVRLGSNEGD